MLSKLSRTGLSSEAIYLLESEDHKEFLQRKARIKDAKCGGENGESEANAKKKQNLKESK